MLLSSFYPRLRGRVTLAKNRDLRHVPVVLKAAECRQVPRKFTWRIVFDAFSNVHSMVLNP